MIEVKFEEKEHKYRAYDKESGTYLYDLISTTQLMSKHGLTVDYSDVPEHVLKEAAEFGTEQHNWLEKYFTGQAKLDELSDIAKQGASILEHNNFSPIANEMMVYNEIVAGTLDMLAEKKGLTCILDFKFTYNFNRNAVTWQLNIYKTLIKELFNINIDELYCLWYNKQKGVFELREIPVFEEGLIEKLFDLERQNLKYIDVVAGELQTYEKQMALDKALIKFAEAERHFNKVKTERDKIINEMKSSFETFGITTYETDNFKLTYVPEGTSVSFDTKKIIEDVSTMIDLDKYKKTTVRKSYVRMTDKIKDIK